jgi:[ribosomal protein S5]-alanine N-acetyltransferase
MTVNETEQTEKNLPLLETERLLMRMFDPKDLDDLDELFNDEEVQKHLVPQNKRNREQVLKLLENLVRRWKERGFGIWCVTEKDTGKVVGYCGFQFFDKTTDIELLFGFKPKYWGKGFATESAKASLKFGFEKLSFQKVYAATDPQNIASRRVLEKLNMNFVSKETYYGIELVTYSIDKK